MKTAQRLTVRWYEADDAGMSRQRRASDDDNGSKGRGRGRATTGGVAENPIKGTMRGGGQEG